jgi:uncharacterized protein (DUF58 family)
VKPGKGMRHSYEIVDALFGLKPKSKYTDLSGALKYALNLLKRRSVIFLISDFVDENYMHNLKGMARKHDLVVLQVYDHREFLFPSLGIVPLFEKESGRNIWVNSSSSRFKNTIGQNYRNKTNELEDFCRRNDVSYLSIDTSEDYVPKLIKLFAYRNKTNPQRAR